MQTNFTIEEIRRKNNLDDSDFFSIYKKFIVGNTPLSENEKLFLLKVAIIFLTSKEDKIRKFGYRIILGYSNKYQDYQPLYEIALDNDYIPIVKFIEQKYLDDQQEETFSVTYLKAYQENFKLPEDIHNIYRSKGQMVLSAFSKTEKNIAVVAPTSYGKSEMIISKLKSHTNQKVCIIVPSKALLAQTKKNLLRNGFKKIITHPDMFNKREGPFLSVLTQERLLRLLQKNKNLFIDLILIDEAHNLLESKGRASLLAQVLLIAQKRKNDFVVNFFTPFLMNVKNLKVSNHNIDIKGKPINEYMKIEKFFFYTLNENTINRYDQFLNRIFPTPCKLFDNDIEFVLSNKSSKNILYLNRPSHAEKAALHLSKVENDLLPTPEIEIIVKAIGDLIHPEYNLIKCIRKGVVYHHGNMPDVIRLYVEDIFSKYHQFKYIVTTSTLLEGVNIPAEKIFLLTPIKGKNSYLTPSQFKNLIGRVCRFKEVFDLETGNLKMLEPDIYLIKGSYAPNKFNPSKFYSSRVDSSILIEDSVKNPLLEYSENPEGRKEALEYLENMEQGSSGLENIKAPISQIGNLCFENSIFDFNIIQNELVLNENLSNFLKIRTKIISPGELIEAVSEIFLQGVTLEEGSENIARLKQNKEARAFYSMFISWRAEATPYPLMINNFLFYWGRKQSSGQGIIYVGSKWGEIPQGGFSNLYVDLTKKNNSEKINLAIAKIKEEQEFIDFNILKYIEILNELNLIDEDFFNKVKYGTSDKYLISLLKNGFSMELSKLILKEQYFNYVQFNFKDDSVTYGNELINQMKQNNENEILIFETECNL